MLWCKICKLCNFIQAMALHFYHILGCEYISSLRQIHQQIWTRKPPSIVSSCEYILSMLVLIHQYSQMAFLYSSCFMYTDTGISLCKPKLWICLPSLWRFQVLPGYENHNMRSQYWRELGSLFLFRGLGFIPFLSEVYREVNFLFHCHSLIFKYFFALQSFDCPMLSQWLPGRNYLIFLPLANTDQLYPSFCAMFIFPPLF